jgi:glycosyltransferase
MKISIITICFNNEKDIRPTIESVVNQTYSDVEYIIVDGASKDNTLSIVNEYKSKINRIISEPDRGWQDAINKGIKAATGDVIGLIHAGDRLYDNDVIAKIAEFFQGNDIDICFGHSKVVTPQGKCVQITKHGDFNKKAIKQGWMPSHQSIYVKRELFDVYGDYKITLYSDYEWFIRYFYFADLKIKRIDAYILYFTTGGISTTKMLKKLMEGYREFKLSWNCNGAKMPLFLVPLKYIRNIKRNIHAVLYNHALASD